MADKTYDEKEREVDRSKTLDVNRGKIHRHVGTVQEVNGETHHEDGNPHESDGKIRREKPLKIAERGHKVDDVIHHEVAEKHQWAEEKGQKVDGGEKQKKEPHQFQKISCTRSRSRS